MSDIYNIKIFLPSNKVIQGKIYRSWTPFNYDNIINSLPLITRAYFLGKNLVYFPLKTKFKTEKYIDKINRGQILILHYINSLSLSLSQQKLHRFKATLVGEITHGLENLKFLKVGDIVTIKGVPNDK